MNIITDYAHHPTEIKALIESVSNREMKRILVIFQPHRYSRTRAMKQALAEAFKGVHRIALVPVYAASEAPLEGGTSEDLFALMHTLYTDRVSLHEDVAQAWVWAQAQLEQGIYYY